MKLEKIQYSELNAKQKEVFNFQKLLESWRITDSTASSSLMTGKALTFSPTTKTVPILLKYSLSRVYLSLRNMSARICILLFPPTSIGI
ncbi:hypothetical protein [Salinisphaera sp. S4-8]|uniref:hypothetical protein n=1 Tax=Salinisphaera sp. S4-8 TaxID=633357 RepID=UPI00333E718E